MRCYYGGSSVNSGDTEDEYQTRKIVNELEEEIVPVLLYLLVNGLKTCILHTFYVFHSPC